MPAPDARIRPRAVSQYYCGAPMFNQFGLVQTMIHPGNSLSGR
jgi:hypothetical protein